MSFRSTQNWREKTGKSPKRPSERGLHANPLGLESSERGLTESKVLAHLRCVHMWGGGVCDMTFARSVDLLYAK